MSNTVSYRRGLIKLPFNPRKGECESCNAKVGEGKIKITNIHHMKYSYPLKEVRKFPLKALENTLELCVECHRLADCVRKTEEKLERYRLVQNALWKKRGILIECLRA